MTRDIPDDVFEKIKSEYEASLAIPSKKPEKQFFVCPVGLVGSGKTTVMKPLAEKLFLVRISGDEIRIILKNHGFGYDSAWEIGRDTADKYAEMGYSIAHDTDGATPRTIETLEERSKRLGAKLIWVHVNPPEDFIINKLMNYKHTWLFRDGKQAVENYMNRKELHRNLQMKFSYTFDTSKLDIQVQIDEASKLIWQETQK